MIGREREAAAVARFVERVPSGPVGLLIEGEPGIGKTTVLSEAIRAANDRRYRVLQARPSEAEADLSFAALGDLVAGDFDHVKDGLPAPQRQALEVALLLQEADEPADPLTTANALLTALTILSNDGPLVIAVDDAQWMDQASKRALGFSVRRLPQRVGVVVASRVEDGPVRSLDLERALAPGNLERLVVGPLSLAALHHLIQSRLGLNLSRPMLVRVAEASGGNPFFALEIAGALARATAPPALGDLLPLPRTLHDLLSDRVDRLSTAARAVASAAAALSRPTAETVEAAVGTDLDVDAALLEVEEAGVLVSDGDRLRFSHPLLASAIYGSLSASRRRALHRRLATVVGDPEERARHLARSATAADEGAAAMIEEAAALATRRGAPESAAELYDAAYRLTPAEHREELARRMLGAAQARSVAGDLGGARELAASALETARTGSLRARALLLLGSLASYTETMEARIGYQEQALAEAGDDLALRIEILLALFEQIGVDPAKAGRRADEAISLLRERDDAGPLAQALISKFIAEAVLGRGANARLLDEALELEAASTGPVSNYPLIWFHWIDDLEATRARHRLHEKRDRDRGDVVSAAENVEFLAMAEFRAGNWAQAEQTLEDACETLAQLELRGPFTASFADRSVIDGHRGRIERARWTLLDILGVERLDLLWRMVCHSAQGAVEFCASDYAAADRAWTAMRDEARVVGWIDFLDDRSEPDHVEALLALGKVDEARRVLEHLEWRGRTLPRAWIDAGLPRARALVLAAEGKLADALAILDSSPSTGALPFEHARLLLVRGQIERRANRKLAARASLTEALAVFEKLGSPPWAQRARDEITRLGLRHRAPGELTEGERRIAELAVAGMTNRQVADAAFVSPKTVEANLARVYQKLGIRSRAELGARMSAMSREGEPQS
ncbi:MAG TPA: AAA family ATPase [Candidatus Sulfomarinibacteraceae bacterium]|nr:AAA family ATPase [Candidatus Sulfomarinibacteraceae bacterium]